MQACLERARLAARTDLPVLILGESGTGKTILARAIHNSSARANRPFVSFNAAALSETLIDSQLFGHERGAFTGAQTRVKGKFELADRGTLFLDEIADLSPQGQSKILRAIEYGEFERLGADTVRQADVRVLSATHHPAAVLVKDGSSAKTCSTASTASRSSCRRSALDRRTCPRWWPARSRAPVRRRARQSSDSIARPPTGCSRTTGRATFASSRRWCTPRWRSRLTRSSL